MGGGRCWRHHGLTRAGAAGGCGGRKPHLLPLCGGTREMISSKWKKRRVVRAVPGRGVRAARCCRRAVPRLLLPCGAGEGTRVPVQGLASEAAGDSDTYQAIFCCKYPRSVISRERRLQWYITPPVKSVLFPTRMQCLQIELCVLGFPSPGGSPSIGGGSPMALLAGDQDGLGKFPRWVPVPCLEKQSHPCYQAIQWEGDH